MEEQGKFARCKHANLSMDYEARRERGECELKHTCTWPKRPLEKDAEFKSIDPESCEECPNFKSKFIEYPLTVNGIETKDPMDVMKNRFFTRGSGKLVRVRPCDEKYEGKTVLGLMLGEIPAYFTAKHKEDTGILEIDAMYNPAILVLETRELVWGYNSWWSVIESKDDLKDITDEAIASQSYMELIKALYGGEDGTDE